MEPLRNLIYFSCVSKGPVILARHRDLGDEELEEVAVECLGKIPPFHSRFTHATRSRRFCFLMDPPFVYCAIVDEALGKAKAFAFLEQVREDFKRMLKSKPFLSNNNNKEENLQGCELDDEFAPVFRRLVNPCVGIPRAEVNGTEDDARADREENEAEPEVCSPTASVPLYEKTHVDSKAKKGKKSFCPFSPLLPKTNKHEKKKVRDQVSEVKEIIMENSGKALEKGQKLEVIVDGSNGAGSALQLQRSVSMRNKGQQLAQSMWWRNVRVVIILDLVICMVLFGVWLCICHGFQCVS